MKKNRIFSVFSAAVLLGMGACSSDTLMPGSDSEQNVVHPEDEVFLAVNFDLPTAKTTRSYTDGPNSSNGGTEIGSDAENEVKSAAIVLANVKDNSFIAAATETKVEPIGTNGDSYRSSSKFSKTDLADYYTSEGEGGNEVTNHEVNVFVFCNPTQALRTLLEETNAGDTNWYNYIGEYDAHGPNETAQGIWGSGSFLMSNSSIATRTLPATLDDWDNYSTVTTPFNLSGMNSLGRPNQIDNLTGPGKGNVEVERAAARYDFRDGALDGYYIKDNEGKVTDETYNGFKAQTYHVVLDSDKKPLVNVFLGKMSLVNMNKKYFYLRHVSNNGQFQSTTTDGKPNDLMICKPELPWYKDDVGTPLQDGNYVVDASLVEEGEGVWSEWKYSGNAEFTKTNFAEYLNYPFFNSNGLIDDSEVAQEDRWDTYMIKKVLDDGRVDNPENWNLDGSKKSYKVWRYLTEGTIPGINSQKNSVSNGVVFKGKLQPDREAKETDDYFTAKLLNELKTVSGNPDSKSTDFPILYLFSGHVYCTWDHIRRMALSLSISDITWNPAKEKWDFTINRSTTLYNAVFGNGGFGSMKFTYNETDHEGNLLVEGGSATLVDDIAEDPKSANYLYKQWKAEPVLDEQFEAFRDAAVASNIALYMKSYDKDLDGWAYYCYYYYWNRHNDNGQNGVMGPMEFAVVRNNVYKLAVTKISRLGHPRISANDPDKPTPNTPDEKGDIYLTVTCTTLPWVVRLNNIEF